MTCAEFVAAIKRHPDPDAAPADVYTAVNGHLFKCDRCARAMAAAVALGLLKGAFSGEEAREAALTLKAFVREQAERN